MHLSVRTRSLDRDYAFVGPPPADPWWDAYAPFSAFEYPTLLFEYVEAQWHLFLSAIPSARRDRVGTRIRYSLVLRGTPSEAEALDALLAAWLADPERLDGPLARALDAQFGEGDPFEVSGMSSEALVRALPRPAPAERFGPASWCGPFDPVHAQALRAHVREGLEARHDRGGLRAQ